MFPILFGGVKVVAKGGKIEIRGKVDDAQRNKILGLLREVGFREGQIRMGRDASGRQRVRFKNVPDGQQQRLRNVLMNLDRL